MIQEADSDIPPANCKFHIAIALQASSCELRFDSDLEKQQDVGKQEKSRYGPLGVAYEALLGFAIVLWRAMGGDWALSRSLILSAPDPHFCICSQPRPILSKFFSAQHRVVSRRYSLMLVVAKELGKAPKVDQHFP